LFYVSLCLEADARDWFYDNPRLCSTWSIFTQNLLKTFESSGKGGIAFNRLRHYEQGINQDVRHYYFEVMKLCKEANPIMDDVSKLQYLKDGLKPSLRFDVLLKNPKNPEEFLEYAQMIEELKSLDAKQDVLTCLDQQKFTKSPTINSNNINNKPQQINQPSIPRQPNHNNVYYKPNYNNTNPKRIFNNTTPNQVPYNNTIPKPPYQCYKCEESPQGGGDSCNSIQNPSPIFINAKINQIYMRIMFDSGSTKSFINQIALKRTQHLPIHFNQQHYVMADGHTPFEVIGTVRIFIEMNHIKTNILVGVVIIWFV
ncbi:unnamed protein product, partial [Rotaria sp. Silwood2]